MRNKRIIRYTLAALLTPPLLVAALMVAIYLPPVQNWAVRTVARIASEKTGMEITVGRVSLVFPLDLGVHDVLVVSDLNGARDTIADIRRAVVDVQLRPLFDGQVEVDRLEINEAKVNTADFIASARVKGTLGHFSIASHGIALRDETVKLNDALINDARLDIALRDTVDEDTTETHVSWRIDLDNLRMNNCDVLVRMPGDTLQAGVSLGRLDASRASIDLGKAAYSIASIDVRRGGVTYNDASGRLPHLADITNLSLGIDSLYFCSPDVRMNIRHLALHEQRGIGVAADGRLTMDLTAFDSLNPGDIFADINARIGIDSLFRDSISMKLTVKGNPRHVDITRAHAFIPKVFDVSARGYAENVTDMDRLLASIHIDAETKDMSDVKRILPPSLQKTVNIPRLTATADVDVNASRYDVSMRINEGKGSISGNGSLNASTMAYTANLDVRGMMLNHFVKGYGLGLMDGKASVVGHGIDPFSPHTKIQAKAGVNRVQYDKWDLSGMALNVAMSNGRARLWLDAHNELLDGIVGLDALMSRNPIDATFTTELNRADLFGLHITDSPLTVGACAHVDIATDMRDYYKVQGLISDLTIIDTVRTYRPDDMVVDLLTRRDTTHAVMDCGDFHLNADVSGGYRYLTGLADNVNRELHRQWDARIIDEMALRAVLPRGHMYLSSGQENPIARMIGRLEYTFHDAFIDVTSSPLHGLNGTMSIDTLRTPDVQLDEIRLRLHSDEETMRYEATVENGKDNPQYSFLAHVNGRLQPNGTSLWVALDDADRQRGVELSLAAAMEQDGIRMRFDDKSQILGYKAFSVNSDNYVFFAQNARLSADVKMRARDGMGIQIYTDDDNVEALQDVTLSLHKFDIEKLLSVVPYTPDVRGILNGDFHAIITPENLSVSSDVALDNLVFENSPLGNVSTEFVYIPMEDGTHHIDGILYKEGEEVATVIGEYNPEGEGNIDATMTLQDFPLDFVNGFVTDQIVGLKGLGEGEISIKGSLSKPDVNGEVFLQDAALVSVPYGVKMRFDDDPVRIVNSRLLLENFQMYASNNVPLLCQGYIDFADLDRMYLDMRMKATNFQIIDAKETRRSEAYGKAFVNFYATMSGFVNRLSVRGQLDLLPTTDLYYILRDSPITTDNRLKELVQFTNLSDDVQIVTTKPEVNGLDVNMKVNIKEGSHVKCWLNTTHTNYVDLLPGGELLMSYKGGDISLRGRCTITEGEMKYSLPIIPLKTFHIAEGSYVEFNGDMMNPRLSITATEQNKASANVDGTNQMVMFDTGVVLSKTLQDMGLEFIIDAPENQTISDELRQMSMEDRGKLAVTMLTTGMYLSDNTAQNFTMNTALSAFLQQEINQIAGSALRTLDLSVGLENSTDETGRIHTDYAFKFAKRFWNNRLSISVGGKISTGPDVTGQNSTFFDNVELQYRLSDTSNQYLQLFYKRAVYDFLEGYVSQYGAGYIWKRKLQDWREILNTKNK